MAGSTRVSRAKQHSTTTTAQLPQELKLAIQHALVTNTSNDNHSYRGPGYPFGNVQFEEQKFTASDGGDGDRFGVAVAIDGDTALTGALLAAVNGHSAQGAVYVFERSGESWSQVQKLVATDGAAFDRFGGSVAIEGDTALIGGWGAAGQRGALWVFTRSAGTWTQQARLDASDGATNNFLGQSVALSGDTAIAGYSYCDCDADGNSHTNLNADSDRNSDSHSRFDTYSYTKAQPNTQVSANSAPAPKPAIVAPPIETSTKMNNSVVITQ